MAESKGHSWEKGDEHDYYGEAAEDEGEKGEKGYESKHGYVFICHLKF